jgi:lipoprotein-releasing system permease protein
MGAIAVSAGAMFMLLSVFNGLQALMRSNYTVFYPDIRITAARGKFFTIDSLKLQQARQIAGVTLAAPTIEDQSFAVAADQQKIVTLKGVTNDYLRLTGLKTYLTPGSDDTVSMGHPYTAIAGAHIMSELGVDINNLSNMVLNYPNPEITNPGIDPLSAISTLAIHPAGEFVVSDEFDSKYVLAPLFLVQALFHQSGRCSAIELKTEPGREEDIRRRLVQLFGSGFKVETRYEQNKTLFMVMSSEKLAMFAILVLVMFIATFNMVGALSMLVLQKRKDIAILRAMGADSATIQRIFLLEGVLWSAVGGIIGIIVGAVICTLQLKYGLVKMGGAFVVDAFPVEMHLQDVALDLATILTVGLIISWYPAVRAVRAADPSLKSS